jgi:serine/threonine protein kinase
MSSDAKNGPNESNDDQELEDIVGSESYISPEMILSRQYSYASDLWALGVIIYQMFSASLPFKGKNQDETFELIKKGEFEMAREIPLAAQDLVRKLLVLNPE